MLSNFDERDRHHAPGRRRRQAAPSIAPFLIDTRNNQLAFNR
jgi:hypothetical protein